MGAQGVVETKSPSNSYLPSCHYGQSHARNEGHGRHESHEGNEEESRDQDRKGPHGQGGCLPWIQGQDHWWLEADRLDEELAWKDREQEGFCSREEEVRQH